MDQNTKIILLAVLSAFLPFVGIPLLVITLVKNQPQENKPSNETSSTDTPPIDGDQLPETTEQEACLTSEEPPLSIEISGASQKQLSKSVKIMLIVSAVALFLLVLGLILALAVKSSPIGTYVLLIAGFFELCGAGVLFGIFDYKHKYTCPECGTKRKHHRQYLRTTQKEFKKKINEQGGSYYYKRTVHFDHEYLDTYTCPNCGETFKKHTKGSGGYINYDQFNQIEHDGRKAPIEI